MSANDPLRQALERLSAKWREQEKQLNDGAESFCRPGTSSVLRELGKSQSGAACAYGNCADELSALLAGERRAQEEPTPEDRIAYLRMQLKAVDEELAVENAKTERLPSRSDADKALCSTCPYTAYEQVIQRPASPPAPPVAGAQEPIDALRHLVLACWALWGDVENCEDCGDISDHPDHRADACAVHSSEAFFRAVAAAEEACGPCPCGHRRSQHFDEDTTRCRECSCDRFRLASRPAAPAPSEGMP